MESVVTFSLYVALVALGVNFMRTVADKWGILEWLQMHAPNDFFHKLFTCSFCQSFWLGLGISIILAIFVEWWMIFIPIFSSPIRW